MWTYGRADAAVVAIMILGIVYFFPAVAGMHVEQSLPGHSRRPCRALKCLGRAGNNALPTRAAKAALQRWTGLSKRKRSEHCAQAYPRAKGAGDELTVTTNPTKPCAGGNCFVRKISTHAHRIAALGCSQGLGANSPLVQGCRKLGGNTVDTPIDRCIQVSIGLVGTLVDAEHHRPIHGQGKGQSCLEAPTQGVCWRGKWAQISHSPQWHSLAAHPLIKPGTIWPAFRKVHSSVGRIGCAGCTGCTGYYAGRKIHLLLTAPAKRICRPEQ